MIDFKDIAKIFEEIELRLISSLKRNLGRHKKEEQQENFQWTAWQAEKLRNLEKFRRENTLIMNEYTDIIDSETRQLMEEQFNEGMNGVSLPQSETISETPQVVLTPEPKFFGVDNTKITKLIDDVVNLEKHAETAALRTMDDVYRQTVHKAQLAMSTGTPLQEAIDMSVKDFLDKGINCIVYRDGRRVNIADYVRMALKTTSTRATLQGESEKFKAMGYDTVQVSSYGMCSKTCLPWQGRPYINDVFILWDGEVEERENGELWGKSHYCGKWFPLLSTAIHAGLFHPNCRHTIAIYRDGDPLPEPMDNSEIEKRYKLEQKQRRLENEVRKARRKAEGFSDPENIKKAKKEVREAQKKLREFIEQTNAAYGKTILKRDYDREKIYDGEVNSPAPSETPVNVPSDTKGKAVDVAVKAPETAQRAYQDEKIPERLMGYEKQSEISENRVDKSAESDIMNTENIYDLSKYNYVSDNDFDEWKSNADHCTEEEYRQICGHKKINGEKGGYVRSHCAWEFNAKLRNGEEHLLDEDDKRTLETIRKLCRDNTTDRNIILDRFVESDYLVEYNKPFNLYNKDSIDRAFEFVISNMLGTEKVESAIVSASYGANVLVDRSIHIRLHCPKGTHLFVTDNSRESEVLFHDDLTYEIVSCEKEEYRKMLIKKYRLVLNVVVKNNGL